MVFKRCLEEDSSLESFTTRPTKGPSTLSVSVSVFNPLCNILVSYYKPITRRQKHDPQTKAPEADDDLAETMTQIITYCNLKRYPSTQLVFLTFFFFFKWKKRNKDSLLLLHFFLVSVDDGSDRYLSIKGICDERLISLESSFPLCTYVRSRCVLYSVIFGFVWNVCVCVWLFFLSSKEGRQQKRASLSV